MRGHPARRLDGIGWRGDAKPSQPRVFHQSFKRKRAARAVVTETTNLRRQLFSPTEDVGPVPPSLRTAIEAAQPTDALRAEWADAEIQGYSVDTWQRAADFLIRHAEWLSGQGFHLPPPTIGPGPDHSIDLHWETAERELLLNIPSDPGQLAGLYGDDTDGTSFKGKLNLNRFNDGLLVWLKQASDVAD